MRKHLKPAISVVAASLLLVGCGGGGGSSSSTPFTIGEDDAPDAAYTTQTTVYMAETALWSIDDLWTFGAPVKAPARAKTPVSPLAAKMGELVAQAKASGGVSPMVAIPADTDVPGWCGGNAVVNGTITVVGDTTTLDVTASFTNFDQCLGAILNGDASVEGTAIDLDDGDDFIDEIDFRVTADNLDINSFPGQEMTFDGRFDVVGDFHNEVYTVTLNVTATGGDVTLKFSNFDVYLDESAWPELTTTLDGRIYVDGDYIDVTTPEDIWFEDIEDNFHPQLGVLSLNGKGELLVIFGTGDGDYIQLELDGNEDGDLADASDWESGQMTWDEFYALLGFDL